MGKYTIMAIVWAVVILWIGGVIFANRKVHPKALFLLFFAEFWERFSYYGMRALLVLYMVDTVHGGFHYEKKTAYGVYAAYGAMVYATPIVGGYVAEKLFGYKKAILWGGALMAAGHFAMAFQQTLVFYLALALLIVGNGFFKPNISSFIATFYEKNDPRKDGAYTLFYMGINAGAFLTPLTCGIIGEDHERFGWHYGFGLAGVGMVLGLAVFLYAQSVGVFGDNGNPPNLELYSKNSVVVPNNWWVYLGTLLALPVLMTLIHYNGSLDIMLGAVGLAAIMYLVVFGFQHQPKEEGQRVWVIAILLLFTTMFWTFFELAGSAISLYTKENVNRVVAGNELSTSVFQSINPAFIIFLAPVFSWLWGFLADKDAEPSAPIKFSLGLALLGAGFLLFGVAEGSAVNGLVPVSFLILAYLLHTLGELCLSPVGLSLVTKLAPVELVGLMMGIWFLSSSIAHQAGKFIANLTTGPEDAGNKVMTAVESLPVYTGVFMNVGYIACGAAAILLVLSPVIKKLMHGVK
ncbi:MAG TPA: MFS transporter [Sorangium sp.]|nr:MFS transporter [Sorangium sp.]